MGSVALITGAGSGLGEAMAHRLAAAGHAIAVNDRAADRAERVAGELTAAGHTAAAFAADVTDHAAVDAMVLAVEERLGEIAVLVTNAGIGDTPQATLDTSLADWRHVIDVNLVAVFACAQRVGADMVARGTGVIVNVASVVGKHGVPGRSAYGPTKAAVINLTKTLATEWAGSGVRVDAVAPGYIRTPLFESIVADGRVDVEALERRIPQGRLGRPQDIANAVAFLASDEAAYVNGETLTVDGAMTASLAIPM